MRAMASRISLLLAAAILTVMALYFLARYLVVAPIAAIAPRWTPVVVGASILIALMLVVNIVARLHDRFAKLAVSTQRRPYGRLGVAGQSLICAAHIVLLASTYRWLSSTAIDPDMDLISLAGLLYAGGVAAILTEWRHRT
jgi:hypothetical protein